jgi:integrase
MAVPLKGFAAQKALSEGFQGFVSGKRFPERSFNMARPPKPYYARGAWRSDFAGIKNCVLLRGPKNADTRLLADKELLKLREEAKILQQHTGMSMPFASVVEQFLECYVGRPAYDDFYNELHWFMGGTSSRTNANGDQPKTKRGKGRPNGGRFGVPCKNWPIYRINASVVERYLRQRKKAGLSGYHAFVVIRTLMNWAKKKGLIPTHDLDRVEPSLRRKGRRRYLPPDADVVRVFKAATGKFKDLLLVYMLTGIRPSELRTTTIDEFDQEHRQWVLWRHKVIERTGMPKVVPLSTDDLVDVCTASAGNRPGSERLFLNRYGKPWSYNSLRLRWYRLRTKLKLDPRFTLYCLRHWYLTMAIESGEDGAIVSELAGHADHATLDFYKKIRNQPLHQAARRVAQTIERAGISGAKGQTALQ